LTTKQFIDHDVISDDEVRELELARDLEGLILTNARLLAKLVHRYRYDLGFDELFSELLFVVIRDFNKFDAERGRFYHYCYWSIKTARSMLLKRMDTIYEPNHEGERLEKVGECYADHEIYEEEHFEKHDKLDFRDFLIYIDNPKEQEAVDLVMIQNMTLKQASLIMGYSTEWIRQLKNEGVKNLKTAIIEEGFTVDDFC
jgi:RNA polymerase sigma factor (sigma-70 family)